MPFGAVVGLLFIIGFGYWMVYLWRRPGPPERPTERSSHYESGLGEQGGGPPPDSGG